jgi:4a-hydroxytetrahydrobiopterin dehydratase
MADGGALDGRRHTAGWTLASPENHGVDIAAWPDFEDPEED